MEEEVVRKSNQLVRLLLAHQQLSIPVKRDDINRLLEDMTPKVSVAIHARANEQIKEVFGMEIVELSKRVKGKKQKAGTYILVSTIKPDLREVFETSTTQLHSLLTLILSLLYVHQKQLMYSTLLKMLLQFKITETEHEQFGKMEANFTKWIKEGYFTKGKIEDGDWTISWGGRAEEELGDNGAEAFILGVFDSEDDEASGRIQKDLKRLSAYI